MKRSFFAAVLCLIAILSSKNASFAASPVVSEKSATEAINRLAADLYRLLAAGERNVAFSPYSISTAFAMTYAGAAGDTADEMRDALHFTDDIHPSNGTLARKITEGPDEAGELYVANSLWPRQKYRFRPHFKKILADFYATEVRPQDFEKASERARIEINDWVAEKTREKILDILAPGTVGANTTLVLVNAIYFNAPWLKPFPEADTSQEVFHTSRKKTETPTMKKVETLNYYPGDEVFHAIKMPYRTGMFSMTILLPREGHTLADLEGVLSYDFLNAMEKTAQKRSVEVWLPKFKIESTFSLGTAMQTLGVKRAFVPGEADFSGMNGARDLCISEAVHKAFVEVEERGTEAAAATAIGIRTTSVPLLEPEEPLPFHVDHPFIYLIRDEISGAILFMGKVEKP